MLVNHKHAGIRKRTIITFKYKYDAEMARILDHGPEILVVPDIITVGTEMSVHDLDVQTFSAMLHAPYQVQVEPKTGLQLWLPN